MKTDTNVWDWNIPSINRFIVNITLDEFKWKYWNILDRLKYKIKQKFINN